MIKVIVDHHRDENCWYINEVSDVGLSAGKICYKSREKAAEVARRNHPYVNIYIDD